MVFLKVLAEQYHLPTHHDLDTSPSTGTFQPIEISPSVIPHYPIPNESAPPLYPRFPLIYKPVLTGKCPVNFSAISDIIERTSLDCSQPLASYVGSVVCCPQFGSLLRIFQGYHSTVSDKLVFEDVVANDCYSDIISILASKGANSSISQLCSVKPSNITGGSCPVKDVSSFERIVNTSMLLDSCSTVDLLKECCRPVCQPAIADAALQLSGQLTASNGKDMVGGAINIDTLNDCKGVVYSWLSRKLSADAANTAFRIVSSCKVNKGIDVCITDELLITAHK